MVNRVIQDLQARMMIAATDDEGMSTAEYAIGTIAAAACPASLSPAETERTSGSQVATSRWASGRTPRRGRPPRPWGRRRVA